MLRMTAEPGELLRQARSLTCHVAGSEANVAAALGFLGAPVRWISALPEGPLGDRVASELRAAGVDLNHVVRLPDTRLGLFFAESGGSPRGGRVLYDRAGSAFTRLREVPAEALAGASFAVLSGITAALGHPGGEFVRDFVRQARVSGATLCVDVNYRALLWSPEEARAGLKDLIRAAQIVVCSERDAERVFGIGGRGADALREFADEWAPEAEIVVLTRAERGSTLLNAEGILEQHALPADVLDPFGAGDAFLAGFLWRLSEGADHATALRAGTLLAALNCTTLGDIARFDAAELEAALANPVAAEIRR